MLKTADDVAAATPDIVITSNPVFDSRYNYKKYDILGFSRITDEHGIVGITEIQLRSYVDNYQEYAVTTVDSLAADLVNGDCKIILNTAGLSDAEEAVLKSYIKLDIGALNINGNFDVGLWWKRIDTDIFDKSMDNLRKSTEYIALPENKRMAVERMIEYKRQAIPEPQIDEFRKIGEMASTTIDLVSTASAWYNYVQKVDTNRSHASHRYDRSIDICLPYTT